VLQLLNLAEDRESAVGVSRLSWLLLLGKFSLWLLFSLEMVQDGVSPLGTLSLVIELLVDNVIAEGRFLGSLMLAASLVSSWDLPLLVIEDILINLVQTLV